MRIMKRVFALLVSALPGILGAAVFEGTVDGQLDNAANWRNGQFTPPTLMQFYKSYGKPLYLADDLTATGLQHTSDSSTATNEFALGKGRTLTVSGGNNCLHLRGTYSSFTLSSGTIKLDEVDNACARIGDGAGSYYRFLATGADSVFDMGTKGTFSIGWGTHDCDVSFRDGATFKGAMDIGMANSSSGYNTVLVADPGTTFTGSGWLNMGAHSEDNRLIVSNQATFSCGAIRLPGEYGGASSKGGNVFRVEDGATATLSSFILGYKGSSNSVEVLKGGKLTVTGTAIIGEQGAKTCDNEVIVDGAGSAFYAGSMTMGNNSTTLLQQYLRVRNNGVCYLTDSGDSSVARLGHLCPGVVDVTSGGTFVVSNRTCLCSWDAFSPGGRVYIGPDAFFGHYHAKAGFQMQGRSNGAASFVVDGGRFDHKGTDGVLFTRYTDVVVTNGGALTTSGALYLGTKNETAANSMTVSDGSRVSASTFSLRSGAASTNRVTVADGGTLSAGTFDLYSEGNANTANALTVTTGGVFNFLQLNVGTGDYGTAIPCVRVAGGKAFCQASNSSAAINIGKNNTFPGKMEVTDGGLVVVSNNYFRVTGAGSVCTVGPDSRIEARTNGGKDVRFQIGGGSSASASLVVDGGRVEGATHCLYLTDRGDITVKNGGYAQFMKFYSDEVGTAKNSTVHVDDATLSFSQGVSVGFCTVSQKSKVYVSGRRAYFYSGSQMLFKGDSTLDVTVPAEGFDQVPVRTGNKFVVTPVDGVGALTVKIDASAYTKASRIVIAQSSYYDMENLDAATFELSDNAVLDLSNPREIAVYVNVDKLYTGEGTAAWSDPNNWTNIVTGGAKSVPAAGEGVVIAPSVAKTIVLDASTPELKSLEIGGKAAVTLVQTNWTTAVRATDVTIRSGSTVTCAGPFADNEMSNRVWIVCKNLTVDAGGAIDVTCKGYKVGAKGTTDNAWPGYGPGTRMRGGATHGGYGAAVAVLYAPSYPAGMLLLPIDDAAEPVQPGSSGGVSNWSSSSADAQGGGGVVRIDATGTVTVNGSILASVGGWTSGTYAGAHAGGAILIHAATFKGKDGVIEAKGGNGNATPPEKTNASSFTGGGGRIAIHYTSAETSGMTVSAGEGLYQHGNYAYGLNDCYRTEADMGTLWFSDDSIWKDGFGKRITGVIANPRATEYDFGDVDFTGGRIRFGADGLTFRMDSLSISGNNVCFELGGETVEQVTSYRERRATAPSALIVKGDLSVSGKGRLDVRAASDGDADGVGATVSVGGSMTVGADGYVYAWSDVLTGARPRFAVSNDVTVAEGGIVSAARRGFAGGSCTQFDPVQQSQGRGPTPGYFYTGGGEYTENVGGGGHGGRGTVNTWGLQGGSATTNGLVSADNPKYPTLAGSGGGQAPRSMWGASAGGGVVEIVAGGAMTVDGTVSADAEEAHAARTGGGAGGSIVLAAPTFGGAGTLSAKGGSLVPLESGGLGQTFRAGAGGGGRIGVVLGNYFGKMDGLTLRRAERPAEFGGTADVSGGVHPYDTYESRLSSVPMLSGGEGTIRYSFLGQKKGLIITIR